MRILYSTKFSVFLILTSALMISYWGLPWNFDATFISKFANMEMRVTFVLAGITVFIESKSLSENVTKGIIVMLGKGMGLFGMFLLLTSKQLYATYPISQQVHTGLILLFAMVILDLTVVPYWLHDYFSNTAKINSARNQTEPFQSTLD